MVSPTTPPGLIRFGPFALDPTNRELRKRSHLIRLQPQALAVLLLLTDRAGQVVSREEIRQLLVGEAAGLSEWGFALWLTRRTSTASRYQFSPKHCDG
jgi:DNA-binding response OmpR family regulator